MTRLQPVGRIPGHHRSPLSGHPRFIRGPLEGPLPVRRGALGSGHSTILAPSFTMGILFRMGQAPAGPPKPPPKVLAGTRAYQPARRFVLRGSQEERERIGRKPLRSTCPQALHRKSTEIFLLSTGKDALSTRCPLAFLVGEGIGCRTRRSMLAPEWPVSVRSDRPSGKEGI